MKVGSMWVCYACLELHNPVVNYSLAHAIITKHSKHITAYVRGIQTSVDMNQMMKRTSFLEHVCNILIILTGSETELDISNWVRVMFSLGNWYLDWLRDRVGHLQPSTCHLFSWQMIWKKCLAYFYFTTPSFASRFQQKKKNKVHMAVVARRWIDLRTLPPTVTIIIEATIIVMIIITII